MSGEHEAVILARQILAEAENYVRTAKRYLIISMLFLATAFVLNIAGIASWWFL